MMGILQPQDLEEIEEFLDFWWDQYSEEFLEFDRESIDSLWSYLNDCSFLEKSLDPIDSEIFNQVWGGKFAELEDWFFEIHQESLFSQNESLINVLQFLWEEKRIKRIVH